MNDEGLELLKEFVESGPFDERNDIVWCCYCDADTLDGKPHEPDCLWVRARAYLRDHGVEVKADE